MKFKLLTINDLHLTENFIQKFTHKPPPTTNPTNETIYLYRNQNH
jgi:hypothetical protein